MRKRCFAAVLVLALMAGLCPAVLAAGKLSTPTDLSWADNYGTMLWDEGDNHTGFFRLAVYKDDRLLEQLETYFDVGGTYDLSLFLAENSLPMDNGVYHFTVQNIVDMDATSDDDSDVAVSPKWTYTAADAQLAAPTDPAWDFPYHTWRRGTDHEEQGALLQLCFCQSEDGDYQTVSNSYCTIGRDAVRLPVDTWALEEHGAGYYKFRILNLSFDLTQTQNSPWSPYSEPYYHSGGPVDICSHYEYTTVLKGQKDATCTQEGYTGDQHCANCDELIWYGKVTPALGHDPDANGVCQRYGCGARVADRKGTLGEGSGALTWVYTGETRELTFHGVIPVGETVFVACYEDGRFTGVKAATSGSSTVEVGTNSDQLRLFWLDGGHAPKCQDETLTLEP